MKKLQIPGILALIATLTQLDYTSMKIEVNVGDQARLSKYYEHWGTQFRIEKAIYEDTLFTALVMNPRPTYGDNTRLMERARCYIVIDIIDGV